MSGLGTLHHDLYFERMRSSIGDKARILDFLRPGSVLDVGAGDGSLVRAMREGGWDAVGVDASPEAVARSEGMVQLGRADGLVEALGDRRFDNVVFCSCLHEVWSYSDAPDRDQALLGVLREAAALLAPGGRLVIRDGVGPDMKGEAWTEASGKQRWTPDTWRLVLNDPEDAGRFLEAWKEMAEPLMGPIQVERYGHVLAGPQDQVAEFLLTYCWGWESLPREGREWYTVLEARRLNAYASGCADLEPVHFEQYLQDGYRDAFGRIGHGLCDGDGQPVPWPRSNAIWVFEKPGGRR